MAVKGIMEKSSGAKSSPFCSKVLAAAKGAGFSGAEMGKLERIITEAEERSEIMAQGISTALDLAGIPPDDMDEMLSILENAYGNIERGREPFTKESLGKLEKMLRDKISEKALARMEADLSKPDESLIGALKKSLGKRSEGRKKLKYTPKRK